MAIDTLMAANPLGELQQSSIATMTSTTEHLSPTLVSRSLLYRTQTMRQEPVFTMGNPMPHALVGGDTSRIQLLCKDLDDIGSYQVSRFRSFLFHQMRKNEELLGTMKPARVRFRHACMKNKAVEITETYFDLYGMEQAQDFLQSSDRYDALPTKTLFHQRTDTGLNDDIMTIMETLDQYFDTWEPGVY